VRDPSILSLALVLAAYLAGSIPFGLLFARARGVDIRRQGSGNIGATNAARVLGKRVGAIVLLLDALKGALPVAAARWLVAGGAVPAWLAGACALAAVVGHCHPLWLRFSGGKGVATSLGVFVVLDPLATGIAAAVFAIVYALGRVVSLGSLAGAIVFPIALAVLERPPALIAFAVATMLLILLRHHDNIARLLRGKEKPL
jgi:glycerol-3-phosphate acyltransferase PlsY